jgi:predicted PurR-regulated permease PerM
MTEIQRDITRGVLAVLFIVALIGSSIWIFGTIVSNVDEIVVWVKSLASFKVPSVPPWIADLPLVGPKAVELWERVAAVGIQEAAMKGRPTPGALLNGLWRSWAVSAYC